MNLNPIFEKGVAGPNNNKGIEFSYAEGIFYYYLRKISPASSSTARRAT